MKREELRQEILAENDVAGNCVFECRQIERLQNQQSPEDGSTFTATCSEFLTIICC